MIPDYCEYEIFPHCFCWNYAAFSENNAQVIDKETAWLQLITHYRHRKDPDEIGLQKKKPILYQNSLVFSLLCKYCAIQKDFDSYPRALSREIINRNAFSGLEMGCSFQVDFPAYFLSRNMLQNQKSLSIFKVQLLEYGNIWKRQFGSSGLKWK